MKQKRVSLRYKDIKSVRTHDQWTATVVLKNGRRIHTDRLNARAVETVQQWLQDSV